MRKLICEILSHDVWIVVHVCWAYRLRLYVMPFLFLVLAARVMGAGWVTGISPGLTSLANITALHRMHEVSYRDVDGVFNAGIRGRSRPRPMVLECH